MKEIRFFLLCLITAGVLSACGEDRMLEYTDRTEANQWIYARMIESYLYSASVGEPSTNSWYAIPENFFYNLRASSEARSGEYTSELFLGAESASVSFGYLFEFQSYDSLQCLRILYVAPQSPASEAGLKRGNWILGYNEQKITDKNYSQLSTTDIGAHSLTIGYGTEIAEDRPVIKEEQTVQIAAPRVLDPYPFEKDTVFDWSDRKVGYLMYTRLDSDPEKSDDFYGTYNEELRRICTQFAAEGIRELVLDLRFSTGSNRTCAQLLGTMLVPASAFGKVFYFDQYNDKVYYYNIDRSIIGSGSNLNLSALYIITSSYTTHVAEMLIHCLSPYMKVIKIGTKTTGQDLFTEYFTDPDYGYTMKLATSIVLNGDTTTYSGGISPTVTVSEKDSLMYPSLPFGNMKELLLQQTLRVMEDSINAWEANPE